MANKIIKDIKITVDELKLIKKWFASYRDDCLMDRITKNKEDKDYDECVELYNYIEGEIKRNEP